MKDNEKVNLKELITEIKNNDVLIPDFQRGFVWEDIEDQKRLLSSVFSRLPIGSILMLKGNVDEFRCKVVGTNDYVVFDGETQKLRKFLIDGQQRVTVLVNAFTDIITRKSDSEIASKMLQNRFFIKLKIEDFNNIDLFGLSNLVFPASDLSRAYFFGNDMSESIIEESSINHKILPPNFKISSPNQSDVIGDSCVILRAGEAKIPLCLMLDDDFETIKYILNKISGFVEKHLSSLAGKYFNKEDEVSYERFLDSLIKAGVNDAYISDLLDSNNFAKILKKMRESWVSNFSQYINLCISDLKFYEITVLESERERAIDIYENLNMGGKSLTTFDLIVAKVARNGDQNFIDQIIGVLDSDISVDSNHDLYKYFAENKTSDLIENLKIYKNKDLNSAFQNVLMNLLVINNRLTFTDFKNLTLNDIKKDKILKLTPEYISNNYSCCVIGIKRALLFMNHDLGISKIEDVLYEHVLLNLALILQKDVLWNDNNVLRKLELWYWIILFSGSYDRDQSNQMLKDLKFLNNYICESKDVLDELMSKVGNIFSEHYFTKQSIILMQETKINSFPKKVVQNMILQYILSKKPTDILTVDQTEVKNLTSYNGMALEKHHLIPLSGVTKFGESTKIIRKDKEHLLNSPINFTLISKEANKKISSSGLHEYYTKISHTSYKNHILPTGVNTDLYDKMRESNEQELQKLAYEWLKQRYMTIKSDILTTINDIKGKIV
jgi:hypothetical protein